MSYIVFRADSSEIIGSGHIMRCLVLAEELRGKGFKIFFITRNHPGNINNYIKKNNFKLYVLPSVPNKKQNLKGYEIWLNASQKLDAEETINIIKDKDVECLIVDHYALDQAWGRELRPYTKKILVVDDMANREFDCDILLNQNLGCTEKDYLDKVPSNCQLLLGTEYAMLRKEFSEIREKAIAKRLKTTIITNILVSIGGSDPYDLTYNILKEVDEIFNTTVVIGSSWPHKEKIQNYSKAKNIEVIVDASNMAKLMFEADIAIGAGGSTSWERCCLALPTLLYVTADNQKMIAKELEKNGAVMLVNSLKKDLKLIADNIELWQSMSDASSKVCNGLGVNKIWQ
jgi:UDP-2,4-diacetamido-2,4,6-trideoxy-beta-L-altropyranose hydrolase